MKRSFPFLFAIFLALVLCCPALGAQGPESITVTSGGVRYRLLVPEGYRHLPETAPEYALFTDLTQGLLPSRRVLSVFVDEQTWRFLAGSSARRKFKNVIVSTIEPDGKMVTKAEFATQKADLGSDASLAEIHRAMTQSGFDVLSPPAIHKGPAEYAVLTLSGSSVNGREGGTGLAPLYIAVDTIPLLFTFSESPMTPDTLDDLAKEAEAYARQYVDAGWVAFAPERVQSAPSDRERIGEDIIQYVTLLGVLAGILGLLHLLRPQPTTPPEKMPSWNERRALRSESRRSRAGNG